MSETIMDMSSGTILGGLIIAVAGVLLGQFLSRRMTRGDQGQAERRALEARVSAVEQKLQVQWYEVREHVGQGYATKGDVAAMTKEMQRLAHMIEPIFRRMYPDAAVPE